MRLILFFFLFSFALSAQNNIIKTVGYSYTNGTPTYTPAKAGSALALDTVAWRYYTWNGSSWLSKGFRVQTISGCSAPAYTPSKFQSYLVINACTAGQGGPELYYWNGSAWVQINEGSSGSGIDTIASYTALRAYTGSSMAVYVNDFNYVSAPDTFTVRGGYFSRAASGTEDAGMLIVASNGVKWQREKADYIAVDWFEGLNASKRIQRALSKCVSGSTLNFILPDTYTLNDEIFLDSIQNLRITGNYPVFKRCNSSASVTTLASNYGGANSITVTSVPSSWEVGDILVAARGVTNDDISSRTVIAGISGTTITLVYQFLNQGGGVFTALAGTSILEDFTMIRGRPSESEGAFGPRGVNRNTIVENIIFDGNKANNAVALGWSVNATISLHGKGSEIRSCVFKNASNENLLGFGLNVHDNYFGDCNGSAFHLSGNDATLENTLTNYFTNNTVENCNIVSRDTSGHNEGVISFSWNGGNVNIIGNYFRSDYGNEAIIGTVTGDGSVNDREEIVFANNRCYDFAGIFGGIDGSSRETILTGNIFSNCGTNNISSYTSIPFKVCGNLLTEGTTLTVAPIHKCDTFNLAVEIPGTNGQYLRHNGTKFTAISQATAAADLNYWTQTGSNLTRASGNVGIGSTSDATTPTYPLTVDNMIGINFGNTVTAPADNIMLGFGRYAGPVTNRFGSHIFYLSAYNATLDKAVGELVIQGRSDAAGAGLGNGITLVTGASGTPRFNINNSGAYTFNTLSGTGNRIPYLNSSGQLLRGTFDPANLFSGSGTANQMAYFNGSMSITSGANAVFNGTNMSLGGIATPSQRLDVAGAIMTRFASTTPNNTSSQLHLGGLAALGAGNFGSVIGPLSSSLLGRPLRTLFIQGASDGLGEGISFITGGTPAERMNIGLSGSILFNALSGTGTRISTLDASGYLGRSSVDPATLVISGTTAGGDLNGTYPNPTVDGLQGVSVSNTAPSTGQHLVYSGSSWSPTTVVYKASSTLDFGSTAAGQSADLTITVTGAVAGDIVSVGPPVSPDANSCFTGWVSAINTVTVRFNNYSASPIDPASATYNVIVTKY